MNLINENVLPSSECLKTSSLKTVVVKKDVAFLQFKKAQDSFVIFTISALNPHKRLFAPTS
jgi:hypothetical protein